ncbi:MAG: hypothetical protein H0T79_23660 [Deltaproteobacteria bacterium]|nr:hypothetical protein [Deltaproteobacteria bacterium]
MLDSQQVQVLEEILQATLKELKIEVHRTDTRSYRDALVARQAVVESLIAMLADTGAHPAP